MLRCHGQTFGAGRVQQVDLQMDGLRHPLGGSDLLKAPPDQQLRRDAMLEGQTLGDLHITA